MQVNGSGDYWSWNWCEGDSVPSWVGHGTPRDYRIVHAASGNAPSSQQICRQHAESEAFPSFSAKSSGATHRSPPVTNFCMDTPGLDMRTHNMVYYWAWHNYPLNNQYTLKPVLFSSLCCSSKALVLGYVGHDIRKRGASHRYIYIYIWLH